MSINIDKHLLTPYLSRMFNWLEVLLSSIARRRHIVVEGLPQVDLIPTFPDLGFTHFGELWYSYKDIHLGLQGYRSSSLLPWDY